MGDLPCDGGIPKIATIDERETVDDSTGNDQSPVDTVNDSPLLFVRIDIILVDVRGGRYGNIIHAPTVLDVTNSLLVCFGVHGVEW